MDMNKVLDEFDNYLFYRYVHLIAETVLIVLRLKYNKVLKSYHYLLKILHT